VIGVDRPERAAEVFGHGGVSYFRSSSGDTPVPKGAATGHQAYSILLAERGGPPGLGRRSIGQSFWTTREYTARRGEEIKRQKLGSTTLPGKRWTPLKRPDKHNADIDTTTRLAQIEKIRSGGLH